MPSSPVLVSSRTVVFVFVGTAIELQLNVIPAIERKAKAPQVTRCPDCQAICENRWEQSCILKNGCCTECYELVIA